MQSKPLVYDQSGVHEMLPQNFIHSKYIYISIHIKGNKKHVNSLHFLYSQRSTILSNSHVISHSFLPSCVCASTFLFLWHP